MGIINNPNENLTGLQIVAWRNEILSRLNDLNFLILRLKAQLNNMELDKQTFSNEDINEMKEIINFVDKEVKKRTV